MSVRYSSVSSSSIPATATLPRFSRRRHIDLQRITSCLCHG
ncbi:putative leader peptide [Streptomyces sp. NPDC050759]